MTFDPNAKLIEGVDFEIDPATGFVVFTAAYLKRRGYCCGNGCRNCPYRGTKDEKKKPV
ncbi:MAG: DUF5522 domain-containing protein [Bdellovibrionota bacterium]